MEIKEIDPFDANVSDLNERTENVTVSELEKSVEEQGIIQPPLVRRRNGDAEVPYEVVVGQRRTMAAQGAGLDSMPVIVMEWDDAEALEASITENVDAFREEVSKRDRALAIERLKELRGWNNRDVADHLSVSEMAVRRWLEPLRDEWEGTIIHPDEDLNESAETVEDVDVDKLSGDTIKSVREITGGGEEGEKLLKRIDEHDLGMEDARELAKKVRRGRGVDEALSQVIEQKHNTDSIKVNANVTFSGKPASAITKYAKERGMTENEVVREAIKDYLERHGYL